MRNLAHTPSATIWHGYDPGTADEDVAIVIVVRAKTPPRMPLTFSAISALALAGIATGTALVAAIGGTPGLTLIFRSF